MKRVLLCIVAAAALAGLRPLYSSTGREEPPAPPGEQSAPRPDSPPPGTPGKPETAPAQPPSPVWVSAEVRFPNYFSSLFYAFYVGDPVEFRVMISNTSKEPVEIPRGLDIRGSVHLTDPDGKPLNAAPASSQKAYLAESLPKLGPGEVIGGLYDLTDLFPDLKKPNVYTIRWESGDWKSNDVMVRLIARYNRDADYEATLQTEEGDITIELFAREAPIHVGNFVNLARLGYYDGMSFHTISRDRSIRTGAPGPDGAGSIGYALPAELTSHKHVAGAVSMYRDPRRTGTDSDGSQFFICLTDLPNRDGKFTIFGQVKKGLDVAKKVGARDTVTDPARPANTPREQVKIRRVVIEETARPAPARG